MTRHLCPTCQHYQDHGWTEGECFCDEIAASVAKRDYDAIAPLIASVDAHGNELPCVTIHPNETLVSALLAMAGGKQNHRGMWVFPAGDAFWQRDEALIYALARIVLAQDALPPATRFRTADGERVHFPKGMCRSIVQASAPRQRSCAYRSVRCT